MTPELPKSDLEEIVSTTRPLWEEVRGKRVFLTGGTGFFGSWLLESFLHANEALALNAGMTVLSRDPAKFLSGRPHLSNREGLVFQSGDVRNFEFPEGGFEYVIHGATEVTASASEGDPLSMLDTCIQGTRRVLDFAVGAGCRKFLVTSSGAVYGRQPDHLTHLPESYQGAPDPTHPASAYGEGKRVSELLCSAYARVHGIECKIARCFAFVGPLLPLNTHFAIGNFIRDALAGREIHIKGDGSPERSYLYASDLAIWLWTLLFAGESNVAYNVGSSDAMPVREVAERVARAFDRDIEINIANAPVAGQRVSRYVPDTTRAVEELGLSQKVNFDEAIERTIAWCAR
jgi:dTDP-glucose 4,6-dehydratase